MRWLSRLTKPFWVNTAFWLFCSGLTILILALGIVPQVCIPQDFFALLETAERMHRGLRPYVDFDTLIGPLSFVPLLIGISFVGVIPYAFVIANAITVPFIGVLTWFYFLKRKPTIINLFLSTYVCLTMCDPIPLHGYISSFSYGMFYDRAGFSILSLLLILVLEQEKNISFIFGVLVGVMFFIKIPFGLSGGVLSLLYFLRNRNIREGMKLSAGFFFISIPVGCYLGFDGLSGMIAYVINCGRIQPEPYVWDRLWQVFYDSLLLLPILPLIYFSFKSKAYPMFAIATDLVFTFLSASLANYCCTPTNALPDLPLFIVFFLFLASKLSQHFKSDLWLIVYLVLSSPFVAYNYLRDLSAYLLLIFTTFIYIIPNQPDISGYISAPGYQHLELYSNSSHSTKGNLFYYEINDGLNLIASHPELKNAKIACIDFADWFSLPRHVPSPDHMPIVIQFGYSIAKDYVPNPKRALEGCSAIIILKNVNDYKAGAKLFLNNYIPYIDTHFKKFDESDRWILLYN